MRDIYYPFSTKRKSEKQGVIVSRNRYGKQKLLRRAIEPVPQQNRGIPFEAHS